MTKNDELYMRYYNTTNPMELIRLKRQISYDDLLKKMILEKDMIADIICDTTNAKKVVEFSNACYLDNGIIIPTVGESLYNKGKKVKILSPNLDTNSSKGFSTVNIDRNNQFGKYTIVTPDKIKAVDLFISEDLSKNHVKQFTLLAGFGKTCMFTDNGEIKDLASKYDEIRNLFCDLSKSNNLEYDVSIISDGNISSAVYTIKRK